MSEETKREHQSRVSRAGGSWEEYVKIFLNDRLKDSGMEVIVGKYEENVKKRSQMLWKFLSMPLKASTKEESIWGDIDLVAVKGEIPITIISCKVSLHGRFTETLFWSLLYRTLGRIKVVLATPDGGRQSKEDTWASEWGTTDNPTKDRLLAESYLDGVYVENVAEWCKYIKPDEGTALGGIVRPLEELPEDLKRWSIDEKFIRKGSRGLGKFF